ncbi:ROK family transcriptional regulator [Bacillus alkalicellulosilyticus]|uniref:ROK family transcriptional regulator n=1 Tax=Alkalihalobacterium alkalicellulosilyticum TaxID=1912214 RepID=UPI0009966373|nr:ROK family transcriptional regulator [Bacillus alkalicellulosilyticus]
MTNHQIIGSFKWMKSINRSLILNMIRKEGPISRAEIAKRSKLSPPTVTNLVNELLETRMIKEGKIGVSSGGRKPILLSINPSSHYVIGVDVGIHKVTVVITDLEATIIDERVFPLAEKMSNEQFLQLLIKGIAEIISSSDLPIDMFIGIGVAMHGIVDYLDGVAVYAPNFQLRNIPIKDVLEAEFKVSVKVENDGRALALAENWFGSAVGVGNIVCVNVGIGVGSGIIMNGRLVHGSHGIAGEIGHTVIEKNGPKCSCGNNGCLQALSAGTAIKERALAEITNGSATTIVKLAEGDLPKIDGKTVYLAAKGGDKVAIEILRTSGMYLGMGIANLINLLNPELIVLSGGVSRAGDFIVKPIKDEVKQRVLTEQATQTKIIVSTLGKYGTVIGAVTLVLKDIFVIESH